MSTDLDLVREWIEARYVFNDDERMDASAPANPLFVLVRTRLGCLWRFRADLPNQLVGELAKLSGREPAVKLPISDAPPPDRLMPLARILEKAGFVTEPVREIIALADESPIGDLFVFARAVGSDSV